MAFGLSCDILRSEAETDAIADEWRQLYARVNCSLFTDYDWFRIWWRTLGKGFQSQTLHIVTGRNAGRLVAVLPLVVVRRKGLRVLQAAGHEAFYCCDMLCETFEQAVELWNAARRSPHYDFADIRDVYAESVCHQVLSAFAHRRDVVQAFHLHSHWSTGKDWFASVPGKDRREHTRHARRLEKKVPVHYEICSAEPLPITVIDAMIKLKVSWCQARGKKGLFKHSHVYEYFHQLLKMAAQQGCLVMSWLKAGDDIIAYNLGFLYKDTLRGYVITYDPDWAVDLPGNIIAVNSISWAIDRGLATVDLAQGGGYKAKFCNEMRECVEFTFSGSLRGRLLECAFITLRALWRILKRSRNDPQDDVAAEPKLPTKPVRMPHVDVIG